MKNVPKSNGPSEGYELDGPGSIPDDGGVEIFLHSFMSRLILGSIQPPIKWLPGPSEGVPPYLFLGPWIPKCGLFHPHPQWAFMDRKAAVCVRRLSSGDLR